MNNEKLNEHYTTTVDSLTDDDGQTGITGVEKPDYSSKDYDTLKHRIVTK